jgi:uncharacterized protein (TIGR03437 family)
MRGLWAAILFSGVAQGQFVEVASSDDGTQIYFATYLRLKTETSPFLPQTNAIHRIAGGLVERITDPPVSFSGITNRSHGNSQLSGDGRIVSYTLKSECVGGSSCIGRPTDYASYVSKDGQPLGEPIQGNTQISRNGRYLLVSGRWDYFPNPAVEVRELRDLQTGRKTDIAVRPADSRQSITSDGRVLGYEPLPGDLPLKLWSSQSVRTLATAEQPGSAIINDTGEWVIYEAWKDARGPATLRVFHVATSRDFQIAERAPDSSGFRPSISNDGTLALYLAASQSGQRPQIWLARTDGSPPRQLTNVPLGISDAVLAGFGKVALAVTGAGQLLRIDTATGAAEELISRTPIYSGDINLVPGSLMQLTGIGLADSTQVASYPLPRELGGVRFLLGGVAVPLVSVSPGEVWYQVPFELSYRDGEQVRREIANSSVFQGIGNTYAVNYRRRGFLYIDGFSGYLKAVHEDFRSLVTADSPARPGEILHLYAGGLGSVSPELASGVPAPVDRLFTVNDPVECFLESDRGVEPLDVRFAGLAPGLLGIIK